MGLKGWLGAFPKEKGQELGEKLPWKRLGNQPFGTNLGVGLGKEGWLNYSRNLG